MANKRVFIDLTGDDYSDESLNEDHGAPHKSQKIEDNEEPMILLTPYSTPVATPELCQNPETLLADIEGSSDNSSDDNIDISSDSSDDEERCYIQRAGEPTQPSFQHVSDFFRELADRRNIPTGIRNAIMICPERLSAPLFTRCLINHIDWVEPSGYAWGFQTYLPSVRQLLGAILGKENDNKFSVPDDLDDFCAKVAAFFELCDEASSDDPSSDDDSTEYNQLLSDYDEE